jgi:23S rRNA (cytidine1920-2'-O)/16S rRNA (cytidine1409-2'-O)-methyltransferase
MSKRAGKVRADELLAQQGLAESRSKARAMILAGDVRVGDRVIDRPAEPLLPETQFTVAQPPPYVSRGGLKLEHALHAFDIDPTGLVAADLGASTGGFTDCLLQHGAVKVYAIDVGYGQLDYRLRQDERVVVMERQNARHLESLPEPVDLVTIDVSFISLAHILGTAARLIKPDGRVVCLIKPQFEAGKDGVDRKGVVRDDRVRRQVVQNVVGFAREHRLGVLGLERSPLVGPAGNVEFLGAFQAGPDRIDVDARIEELFSEGN